MLPEHSKHAVDVALWIDDERHSAVLNQIAAIPEARRFQRNDDDAVGSGQRIGIRHLSSGFSDRGTCGRIPRVPHATPGAVSGPRDKGGRYWNRTSDPFRVREVR